MAYARIQDNMVVEIVKPVDGFSIQQCFHPDLLKNMVSCPDEVQAGWAYDAETGAFTAPQTTTQTTESTDTQTSQP